MALEKDLEFYRKDPDTGVITFDYVTRPSICRNDLRAVYQDVVKVKIYKSAGLILDFTYTVAKAIPEGKELCCVAEFSFNEKVDTTVPAPVESIVCKDAEIYKKDPNTQELVLDYIERPRNVRRDNLGPYIVGNSCKVEFIINDIVIDSFDYTPSTTITTGNKLYAIGGVDFVEI